MRSTASKRSRWPGAEERFAPLNCWWLGLVLTAGAFAVGARFGVEPVAVGRSAAGVKQAACKGLRGRMAPGGRNAAPEDGGVVCTRGSSDSRSGNMSSSFVGAGTFGRVTGCEDKAPCLLFEERPVHGDPIPSDNRSPCSAVALLDKLETPWARNSAACLLVLPCLSPGSAPSRCHKSSSCSPSLVSSTW